jgi:hypothetical protein
VWEERFERSYGFWRGLVDEMITNYRACGVWQAGFARVRCRRGPRRLPCGVLVQTKRSLPVVWSQAGGAARRVPRDEVVEPVGHAQWVFTIPKMLRVHREPTRQPATAA